MGGESGSTRKGRALLKKSFCTGFLLTLLGGSTACDPGYPSSAWEDTPYDHAALSDGFQLFGTHTDAPCTACHSSTDFEPLFQPADGDDCVACHLAAYEREHAQRGFPTSCLLCHTPTVWADGAFDHGDATGGFQLLEVHLGLDCTACHTVGTFEPLYDPADAKDCITCHLADFPSQHTQRGFPVECSLCHTPTAWANGNFDHLAISGGFDLLGIHISLECGFCHAPGTFEVVFDPVDATDCVACHRARYDRAHLGTGYPTTCMACHTPTFWGDGEFDHSAISGGFELLGLHAEAACTRCHEPETFEPLYDPQGANDCVACHRADYDGQHGGSGYPLTCTTCHSSTGWSGGSFDHETRSGGFGLLGVHAELACAVCHAAEDFMPLFDPVDETDCLACHREDYDARHGGQGVPTECAVCHTPTLWSNGTFNHEVVSGGFELLGVHAEKDCVSCHDPDTFEPLFDPVDEADCVNCHQAAYDGQHAGDGFPTTCLSCHTPTSWADANFDHDADYFPIFTGDHAPRWSACATCHADPGDFSVFTCFTCHVHNQTSMDNRHEGRDGYSYVPSACLSCHPDGTTND